MGRIPYEVLLAHSGGYRGQKRVGLGKTRGMYFGMRDVIALSAFFKLRRAAKETSGDQSVQENCGY